MELDAAIQFAIDFNLHDIAVAANLPIPANAAALMYGVSAQDIAEYQAQIDAQLAQTAAALASAPGAQAFLSRFQPGETVLFLGDSITTYRYSYARVLAILLAHRSVTAINRAYSGYTSSHGLELVYISALGHRPQHVFISYGVNDCKRFGGPTHKMLVTEAEYAENMRGIISAFQGQGARVTVLSPTLVLEDVISADEGIQAMGITWLNTDLHARGDVAQRVAHDTGAHFIDMRETPALQANLFCADGLHPNALGEQKMLEHMLRG